MTAWFIDALTAGRSWVLPTGTLEQRMNLAVRTVDLLLNRRMRFTAPFFGTGFGSC
jgi:HTH-type transcriptional repressor of NAD biosynthesis genes